MSWTLIEHQALTSSVASVTLGSGGTIPQTYKTLKLLVSARVSDAGSSDGNSLWLNLNNSSTGVSWRRLRGYSGTSVGSDSGTSTGILGGTVNGNSSTANTFNSTTYEIPNYSGSTNKPVSLDAVGEENSNSNQLDMIAGLWSNTSAVTSIVLKSAGGGNLVSGSTFTLYGLA